MPIDGSSLKNIEEKWPIFNDEPRNVILSLAADGFNPFGELCSTYSLWLAFIINNHQMKFQFKMGRPKIIQIPCHHVLANEIALNLKYYIGLK